MISFLDRASEGNEELYHLFIHFSIAAGAVFLLVVAATVYSILKFRKSRSPNAAQFRDNKKVEIISVAIAASLVGFFGYRTIVLMNRINPPVNDSTPDIIVTGHQWWWEVEYPGKGVTTANEFHIPVGRKTLVELRSADVIHSFWVPNLAGKQDMVPGYGSHIWLNVTRPGTYVGVCGEFCGQQHAWMRLKVVAHSPEDFDRWVAENARDASIPDDPVALSGAAVFKSKSCQSCHAIRGFNPGTNTGPDLTHLAAREYLAGGVVKNTPENIDRWLKDPYKVKPGAHMPNMHLTNLQRKELTAFLNQLE